MPPALRSPTGSTCVSPAARRWKTAGSTANPSSCYEKGNGLKLRQTGYRIEKMEARVEAQVETCTRGTVCKPPEGVGFDCRDPIFIVGLPRSGSTLLEQILASHSMVDGTMELHNILALAQKLRGREPEKTFRYPAILHELDQDYFRRFGRTIHQGHPGLPG